MLEGRKSPNPENATSKNSPDKEKTDNEEQEKYYHLVRQNDDGKFEALVPTGYHHPEHNGAQQMELVFCDTAEDALEKISDAYAEVERKQEMRGIEPTFSINTEIKKLANGKFEVSLPAGKINIKGKDYLIGRSRQQYESWKDARTAYLNYLEKESKLDRDPILRLSIDEDTNIGFSKFDSFDPKVSPARESLPLPNFMKDRTATEKILIDTNPNFKTYKLTAGEDNWQAKIWAQAENFAHKEGKAILEDLKIKDLRALTPRQAAGLATEMVVAISDYDRSDTGKTGETKADKSTVSELIDKGMQGEPNGVCRNRACMVKGIFEALKMNQYDYSRLANTYCFIEKGSTESFQPRRKGAFENTTKIEDGHAWNNFITISKEGKASSTILDATWGKRDLTDGKISGIDHTMIRMEPLVNQIANSWLKKGMSPEETEETQNVLAYYALLMNAPSGKISREQQLHFATRALQVISRGRLQKKVPELFLANFGTTMEEGAKSIDSGELDEIWKVYKANAGKLNIHKIVESYVSGKDITGSQRFLVKNDNLQRRVYRQAKSKSILKDLTRDIGTRIRIREVMPRASSILGEFKPSSSQESLEEMQDIIRTGKFPISIRSKKIRHENANEIIAKAKETLRQIAPERYDEEYGELNDFQVLKKYSEIHENLKNK